MSKPAPGPKIYPYLLRGLRSPDIWRSTIRAARIRALTGARPTRLISARTRNGGGRMTVVVRFCRGSGRATPSRRHSKTATPRSVYPGRNPLNFRGALSKQPELALTTLLTRSGKLSSLLIAQLHNVFLYGSLSRGHDVSPITVEMPNQRLIAKSMTDSTTLNHRAL